MRSGPLRLRRGSLLAAASLALAATAGLSIITAGPSVAWLVNRLTLVAIAVLALGLIVGSEQLAGLSIVPMLAAALIGSGGADGPAWGRSMVIGCVLYLSLEAAWESIERRTGTSRGGEIDRRRLQEVATIVVAAVAVGLGGAAAAATAPTRTLAIRAIVAAAVLLALVVGIRQLRATAPDPVDRIEPG